MTAHQAGQFPRQPSDVGGCLGGIAQRHVRNRKITNGARLWACHSAIPDQTRPALLSSVALTWADDTRGISARLDWSALIGCNRRQMTDGHFHPPLPLPVHIDLTAEVSLP